MTEFGPNGTVIGQPDDDLYSATPKPKRVGHAIFFCGLFAVIAVAFVGFLFSAVLDRFDLFTNGNNIGFAGGMSIAAIMAAFNWFAFFISLPLAWIGMAIAMGGKPKRGIRDRKPYYQAGAKSGAICVGLVTGLFSLFASDANVFFGALLAGAGIGGVSGLACGWLFFQIVRPDRQTAAIDISVF